MNKSEEDIIRLLESISVDQGRKDLASGKFGAPDSHNYRFASSWFSVKEASLRDAREEETLSVAKEANLFAKEANSIAQATDRSMRREVRKDRIIAIIAIIIAAIAAREEIIWSISWLLHKLIRTL
jgi:hypothetical protein